LLLIIILVVILRYRSRKAETKRNEELKIKNQIVLLEQQALQAMMNPHFIFNVMNTIQQAINNSDTYKANVYLSDFAKLIRLNLDISVRSAIPLEEEIAYLQLYLSLEKIRFGDRLSYEISVDTDIDEYETMIPVMLLQPFIENAIWHGILPKSSNGHVQINIKKTEKNSLSITILDNGKGRQEKTSKPALQVKSHISRGMTLTRQRLELIGKITKKEVSLEITDAYPGEENKGTIVKLILPSNLVD
jgi:sensor histidine kinase YesM